MITLSLLTAVLLLFTAYFFVQNLVFPAGEPVTGLLDDMMRYAEEGRWGEAQKVMEQAERSWNGAKDLIALNYAEPDYITCMESFTRLKNAVKIKDDSEVVREASVCRRLVENFVKVVPQP